MLSAIKNLDHTNKIAHDVLSLITFIDKLHVCPIDLRELIEKGINLADKGNRLPNDETMQDVKALNNAFLSCIIESIDCTSNSIFSVKFIRNLLNKGFNKSISCFSKRNAFIYLVFETTKINFFNK
jgi:hypothetical protein